MIHRPQTPPSPSEFSHLRPGDFWGALHLGIGVALTAAALALSLSHQVVLWLTGQVVFAFALLAWFALLHEAGHKTLFRTPWLNYLSGQLAAVLAIIPFDSWKLVHARHHRWAGWHDLDPTTSQTLPRARGMVAKTAVILSWWLWFPAFSIVYRLQNYWNLPRLWHQFPRRAQRLRILASFLVCMATYAAAVVLTGPMRLGWLCGLGLYLSLVMQDLLILSQHTHMPMPQSEGRDVAPFPPLEQELYTRSLLFPSWFSRFLLINLDAHELHHMYPRVPGYWLHTVNYQPRNGMPWWRWIWRAKCIRGDVLLFQNRNQTGYEI